MLAITTAILSLRLIAGALVLGDAPDGFLSVENKEDGYAFFYPQNYKEIPPAPADTVLLAHYFRTAPVAVPKASVKRGAPPAETIAELFVMSIDKPVVATTGQGGDSTEPSPDGGSGESPAVSKSAPKDEAEAVAERFRAASFEDFVKKRMSKWGIVSHRDKGDGPTKWTEYSLQDPASGPPVWRGYARLYDRGNHWLGLMGIATASEFETHRRLFEKSANSLREIAVSEAAIKEMEQYYSRRPEYKDPKFRIERRRDLTRGWKSIDTRNYLILHHSKDDHLLSRLQNDLEAMRVLYEQLFPPAKPVDAVSVVRVCKDRQEYLQYGGAAMSAGYWNSAMRELVLYDNVKGEQGSRLGNQDSYIVLYHEAFHQFIHYSVGELPPHSWFNEGYGDYFSGSKIYANSTKVQEIGTNPWRVPYIKMAVDKGRWIGIAKLIHADQREFYSDGGLYYSEAWSFIYFLNRGLTSQSNPKWAQILPRYFDSLKASYAEELKSLGESPSLAQKSAAGEKARNKALGVAFDDVDVEELQDAWLKFVKRLK
ncbi:MAG: hypothetical protein HY292_03920 [Planctomycetes bacterium]|nr:hypothetical protein [Planctomycetota bacterium]